VTKIPFPPAQVTQRTINTRTNRLHANRVTSVVRTSLPTPRLNIAATNTAAAYSSATAG
jgi:hypothetical protein